MLSEEKEEPKLIYKYQNGIKHNDIYSATSALGTKGSMLCSLFQLGLPLPSGFIISREACSDYLESGHDGQLSMNLINQYKFAVHSIEEETGKIFGEYSNGKEPLLLTVRCGEFCESKNQSSTILNIGLNLDTIETLIQNDHNPIYWYDMYRRFLETFGKIKQRSGISDDNGLSLDDLNTLIEEQQQLADIPFDPFEQLYLSIVNIFESWNSTNVQCVNNRYEEGKRGFSVIVQATVSGKRNEESAAGLACSRNPITGENCLYGKFLYNAIGQELVEGQRPRLSIKEMKISRPAIYEELTNAILLVEKKFKNAQDVEFVVENNKLFILTSRLAHLTTSATLKIAVSMVDEEFLTKEEALLKINLKNIEIFKRRIVSVLDSKNSIIGRGLAASPGAIVGRIAFSNRKAEEYHLKGYSSILCKKHISMDDFSGLYACSGALTIESGISSYAAVALRNMGKCGIVGAANMIIDESKFPSVLIGLDANRDSYCTMQEGEVISLDGTNGNVYKGSVPISSIVDDTNYEILSQWADEFRKLEVQVSTDSIEIIKCGEAFNCDGIGLLRSELQFTQKNRVDLFHQVLSTESYAKRCQYLEQLMRLQQDDYLQLFRMTKNKSVTIRLLDPPFYYSMFVSEKEELERLSEQLGVGLEACIDNLNTWKESISIVQFRGGRVSMSSPEITEMQCRAIFGAAIDLKREGVIIQPQILIPTLASGHEIETLAPVILTAYNLVRKDYSGVLPELDTTIRYKIGCMLETPRICMGVADIVTREKIDFILISSNELTQLKCESILSNDRKAKLSSKSTTTTKALYSNFDNTKVGSVICSAIINSKAANPAVKVGVMGGFGNDLASIELLHDLGCDYCVVPPVHIPITKIAAAQVNIQSNNGN